MSLSSFWQEMILIMTAVMLPLIPSILIYKIFGDKNFTKYQGINKSIQLGGPIAAYFLIMVTIFQYANKIDSDLVALLDAQQDAQQEYIGNWVTIGHFKDAQGEVVQSRGKAYIKLDDYRLVINGVYLGEDGVPVGSWEADEVIVTRQKIVFLWETSTFNVDLGIVSGVGRLRSTYDSSGEMIELRGSWGMLGRPQFGTMLWVKDVDVFNNGGP